MNLDFRSSIGADTVVVGGSVGFIGVRVLLRSVWRERLGLEQETTLLSESGLLRLDIV